MYQIFLQVIGECNITDIVTITETLLVLLFKILKNKKHGVLCYGFILGKGMCFYASQMTKLLLTSCKLHFDWFHSA